MNVLFLFFVKDWQIQWHVTINRKSTAVARTIWMSTQAQPGGLMDPRYCGCVHDDGGLVVCYPIYNMLYFDRTK
jgi:hypothetical protein